MFEADWPSFPLTTEPKPMWGWSNIYQPKIKDYKLLASGTVDHLTLMVKGRLDQGWTLWGQPMCTKSDRHRDGQVFIQAVVKYEKVEENDKD